MYTDQGGESWNALRLRRLRIGDPCRRVLAEYSRVAPILAALVLTRPLGATVGDFLDKPVSLGGLNLSRPLASAVLAIFIVVCVLLLPQRAGRHPAEINQTA